MGIFGENERFYVKIPGREQERLRTAKREQRRSTYEDEQVKKAQESNGSYTEYVTRNIHLSEEYNKLKDQFDAYRGQILVLENDVSYTLVCHKNINNYAPLIIYSHGSYTPWKNKLQYVASVGS